MKLFKNGVGRPSNETKEARRVFIVSIAAIIISVVALLVSLLTKAGILTSNLKGAASYKISYGLYNANSGDISKITYPKTSTHSGNVSFKEKPTYTVKNGKTCTFKGWIIQRTSDGRYRVKNKNTGKNAWYSSSKDKKINWEYNYLDSGSLSVNSSVKLYAAFDCNTVETTTNGIPKFNDSDEQSKKYTGELLINKTYSWSEKDWSGKGIGTIISSRPDVIEVSVTKKGSLIVKELIVKNKPNEIVTITDTSVDGKKTSYTYVTRMPYKIHYVTSVQTGNYRYDVQSSNNLDIKLWDNEFLRVGYTFKGWNAYRMLNGKKTYFEYSSSRKGWYCYSKDCAKKFENKSSISSLKNYTGPGANIYMEAVWSKKIYKEYLVNFCTKVNKCSNSLNGTGVMLSQIIDVNDRISTNKYTNGKKKFDGWYPYRKDNNNILYLNYNSKKKTCKWQSKKATVVPNKAKLGNYIKDCTGTGTEIYLEAKWK